MAMLPECIQMGGNGTYVLPSFGGSQGRNRAGPDQRCHAVSGWAKALAHRTPTLLCLWCSPNQTRLECQARRLPIVVYR